MTKNTKPVKGSKRRVARELAVSILPQLIKLRDKPEQADLLKVINRSVNMLCEHAEECLSEADALRQKAYAEIQDLEIEHPDNAHRVQDLVPVNVTTAQLKEQLINLEQASNLVAEALGVPQLLEYVQSGSKEAEEIQNFIFQLVDMYMSHRDVIDDFIRYAKSKWKVERMVSVDRDILRLACAEALFAQEVPIPVCINEAVELTHRFADERAAKYINGILGDLATEASSFRRTGEFSFALGESSSVAEASEEEAVAKRGKRAEEAKDEADGALK
jgi:transcription antitermination protein NusB